MADFWPKSQGVAEFPTSQNFMRVTYASVENTVHLLTPLSIISSILPFFGRCSTTIDIVTALTTIHCQSKLQINMQVVTCEKMKMSGGLSHS